MLKKIISALIIMAAMVIGVQMSSIQPAEAKDVWAYTAPNQEYTVYVMSESVRMTANNTLRCRTKTVRGMGYDITGWELKNSGDDYYYRVCESEGKGGLVPFEGKWHVLDSEEMFMVFNTCADILQ